VLGPAWTLVIVLQIAVAALVLASVVAVEWRAGAPRPFLLLAGSTAALAFALRAAAQAWINQVERVWRLFLCFAAALAVVLMFDTRGAEASLPAHWVGVAALYAAFLGVFVPSFKEKFTPGGTPPWFREQFGATPLARVPGLRAAWLGIGLLEFAVAAVFALSLASGEAAPGTARVLMALGITLAAFAFAALSVGQNLTGGNPDADKDAGELFAYLGGCFIALMFAARVIG
jgi:hypothetical protein